MTYIYIAIAIVIIYVAFSAILRRRIYKEVDRLEEWKNNIINRPMTDEIGKVKQLQMSGQTEEKFEEWRMEWDDIVGVIIPNIGEQLFDIEDLTAKNRFKKARQLIETADQRLNGIEAQLEKMTSEIQQLVESEEQNRSEIDEVRLNFKKLSTELTKRRGALGQGIVSFDERIERIDQSLQQFDQATLEGSYLRARENLLDANELLAETATLLERYPKLLVMMETTIPAEIDGLREGMKEMEEAGYILDTFHIPTQIQSFEEELGQIKEGIVALECDANEGRLEELSEKIEQLYGALEYEVESKLYVANELPHLQDALVGIEEEIQLLADEIEEVQQSYYIPPEMQQSQEKMGETTLDLTRQLAVLNDLHENNKQTFTSIREMMNDWKENNDALKNAIQEDKQSLRSLREEEWKAEETLSELRDQLLENRRVVQKSNIPGLPKSSVEQMDDAEAKLEEANEQLDQIPLELGRVTVLVGEAKEAVETSVNAINELIYVADKAERVIQFGNRYRSRSSEVEQGLNEAERHFRRSEYKEALERAVQVIEVYEPNVLKIVEEFSTV